MEGRKNPQAAGLAGVGIPGLDKAGVEDPSDRLVNGLMLKEVEGVKGELLSESVQADGTEIFILAQASPGNKEEKKLMKLVKYQGGHLDLLFSAHRKNN